MAMYDRQVATAQRLIKKYGKLVPMTVRTSVTNPDRPMDGPRIVETIHNVNIAFLPLTKVGFESITKVANSEVPKGAVLGYMGAVDFEFEANATVWHNGKTHAIHYMDVLAPNGRKILFSMVFGL